MEKKKIISILEVRITRNLLKRFLYTIFLCLITLLMESCHHVHIYPGKFEILGKTVDNSLSDSVMFFGKVYGVVNNNSPSVRAKIWVDESSKKVLSDNTGSYSLKLPDGVYNIHCQEEFGNNEFIETINEISILPNEKIEINFYLGARVE